MINFEYDCVAIWRAGSEISDQNNLVSYLVFCDSRIVLFCREKEGLYNANMAIICVLIDLAANTAL